MLDTTYVDAYLLGLSRLRDWGRLGCLRGLHDGRVAQEECGFCASACGPREYHIMTRTLKASLLIASMLVVLWTTSSQACHRRRSCQTTTCYCQSEYTYASPQGYYGGGGGYGMTGGGYYDGGTAGYTGGYGYGQPGYTQPGYDFGRPGYNPGGLGGPASGIGVRPGLGAGGFGPGR